MTPRRNDGAPTFTEQARRRQLVECTIDLIAEKGLTAASLSAIAERAGLSKAAVLYHFTSKDNLTQAAFAHVLDAFTGYVAACVAERGDDPRAALRAYVRAMIGYQRDHRRHVRVITETLLDDHGGTRFRAPGQHDVGGRGRALAELLEAGQRAGQFREFDPGTVALAVGGAIDGVVAQWLADPGVDLDAAADELETFALRAVAR
ncbi:TetR family transcriptional regulator [Streptomyces sp. SID5785]|uniref:TetR/AcrR family transcriptional regulator n=1 Tax=Streptomyces sp. SID5785 TaxID=2690309 RepID=UPI00136174DB|nr:TetR/AcrR family transcriptional regulator [Streptomyces sp. SID5785]MZD03692.1 TetR family transcriptional regulator [Streptomyces sp. SID5785]